MSETARADVMIADKPSAEAFVARTMKAIDALLDVIVKETQLVRAGKIMDLNVLEQEKAELVRTYAQLIDTTRTCRDVLSRFAPASIDQLRKRHQVFRAELQINMAALATARVVSESIIQGVSDQVQRKRQPQAYNARGNMQRTRPEQAGGIALNMAL